jgi:hypothetical protein
MGIHNKSSILYWFSKAPWPCKNVSWFLDLGSMIHFTMPRAKSPASTDDGSPDDFRGTPWNTQHFRKAGQHVMKSFLDFFEYTCYIYLCSIFTFLHMFDLYNKPNQLIQQSWRYTDSPNNIKLPLNSDSGMVCSRLWPASGVPFLR